MIKLSGRTDFAAKNMDNRQLELNSLKQSERVHVLLFVEGVTSAMFE